MWRICIDIYGLIRDDSVCFFILWRRYMDKGIISKKIIADLLHTNEENISNLCVVKKGLTNKSYTFQYNYMPYIIRIPGVG